MTETFSNVYYSITDNVIIPWVWVINKLTIEFDWILPGTFVLTELKSSLNCCVILQRWTKQHEKVFHMCTSMILFQKWDIFHTVWVSCLLSYFQCCTYNHKHFQIIPKWSITKLALSIYKTIVFHKTMHVL